MLRRIFLGLVLVSGLAGAAELTLDQILAKHYEAMGGLEKLRALKTSRMTGKLTVSGGQMEGDIVVMIKSPNMSRTEVTMQGQTLVRGLDGKVGWQINPFTGSTEPETLSEAETSMALDNADLQGVLVDYATRGNKVELLGKEDVGGKSAYKLKTTRKNGRTETVFLDETTFLATKTMMTVPQQGQDIEMEVFTSGFSKVDGYTFPKSIEQKVGGQTMAMIALDKVEVNVPLDDAQFKMPAKK